MGLSAELDVAVVGGGPAGSAAALVLARAGRRVALIDPDPDAEAMLGATTFKVGEGLPPAARRLLRELGSWERFVADGHLRSPGVVSAWGSEEPRYRDHLHDPDGSGWHVDRARFDAMLRRAASDAGAHRLTRRVDGVACEPEGFRLELRAEAGEAPASLVARRLIDATGRSAWLARRLGAQRRVEDRLVAFAAVFDSAPSEPDLDRRTFVEAMAEGWWYSALLPGERRIAVFSTDADLPAARQARHSEGFVALLGRTRLLPSRLRRVVVCSRIHARPADTACLAPAVGEGWLAVGDAALGLDPLSSQGMLTALYCGLQGAGALHAELSGDPGPCREYRRRLAEVFRIHCERRADFYAEERRFGQEPFWQRRAIGV